MPKKWSVFGMAACTNNNVEVFHRRIKYKSGRWNLPLYELVEFLLHESHLAEINHRLVEEDLLTVRLRRKYSNLQKSFHVLFHQWNTTDHDTPSLRPSLKCVETREMHHWKLQWPKIPEITEKHCVTKDYVLRSTYINIFIILFHSRH